MNEEPLFKIQNVSKYFGKKVVLEGISVDVMPGEILGIIGASGSGKTTLLNILIGFLTPDEGDVLFRFEHLLSFKNSEIYRSVHKKPNYIKRMIGFAAQKPSFYPNLTIQENLEYFGSLFDLSKDALNSNIEALLKLMELYNSRYVLAKNLSGGMQRRLDIACALVHDPKVLILDEPTSDLDLILRKHIWDLIKIINSKGTTIILSSHHLNEIENLCNRIAILKDQHFIEVASLEDMQKKYMHTKKIYLRTKSKNYDVLLSRIPSKLLTDSQVNGDECVISSRFPIKLMEYILKKASRLNEDILDLKIAQPTLDEIFLSLSMDSGLNEFNLSSQTKKDARLSKKRHKHHIPLSFGRFKKSKHKDDVSSKTLDAGVNNKVSSDDSDLSNKAD